MAKLKTWTLGEVLTAEDVNEILNPDVPSDATTANEDLTGEITFGSEWSGTVSLIRRRDWLYLDINSLTRASGSDISAITLPPRAAPAIEVHPYIHSMSTTPLAVIDAWMTTAARSVRGNGWVTGVAYRGFIAYPALIS